MPFDNVPVKWFHEVGVDACDLTFEFEFWDGLRGSFVKRVVRNQELLRNHVSSVLDINSCARACYVEKLLVLFLRASNVCLHCDFVLNQKTKLRTYVNLKITMIENSTPTYTSRSFSPGSVDSKRNSNVF